MLGAATDAALRRIERSLTRERALFVAAIFLPVLLLSETAIIWSAPEHRWAFPFGHDFVAFWAAARLHAEGGIEALYDLPRFAALQASVAVRPGLLLWHYPPVYLLLILPLAALPFWLGWALFQAGGLAALALAARRVLPRLDRLGWAALLGAPVIAVSLVQGQNGPWFAAFLIGGLAAWQDGRRWLAAGLFALIAAKPQIGLLVPVAILARRDWRMAGLALVATMALLALTTLALGAEAWTRFLSNTAALSAPLTDPALLAQMPTAYASAVLAGVPGPAALALQAALAALAAAAVWWLWSRPGLPRELPLAGLLFAVLMIPPYGFRYDMVAPLAGTLAMACHARATGWRPGERLLAALLWLWPAAFPALALATGIQTGYALLALGLIWTLRRAAAALPAGRVDPR